MKELALLEAKGIKYQLNGALILNDIDICLSKGNVTGLLGQNGAGKTTLLNILSGCIEPTSGSVLVMNKSIFSHPEVKSGIGYLPDKPSFIESFTVREQLLFTASLFNHNRLLVKKAVDAIIDRCSLQSLENILTGQLSKGQAQRVAIAQAIVHKPEILLFDEPTEGLDPLQIQFLRDLILELRQDCTIFVSSHLIDEIEKICDDVIVLHRGEIKHQLNLGTNRDEIKLRFKHDIEERRLANCSAIQRITATGQSTYQLKTNDPVEARKQVIALCHDDQLPLLELNSEYSDLQDIFFRMERAESVHHSDDN